MPSIEFYLEPSDGLLLLEWLSAEDEISFVRFSDGASPEVGDPPDELLAGRYALFHTSYPTVPIRAPASHAERGVTAELYGLMNLPAPDWFSSLDESHPAIFNLTVSYEVEHGIPPGVGLSSMGWIGRRYQPEGLVVRPEAEAWWRFFRQWVTETGGRISRSGPLDESAEDL